MATATHAAFLRGVNLGAKRKVSSAQLRSLFEELGFEEVTPFRTSGNVAFAAGREAETKLIARIEKGLRAELGLEVTVFLRSADEVRALADAEPFPAKLASVSKGKLQVALLETKPSAAKRKEALALSSDEDRLAFGDRELYWLPSGGTRDSALGAKRIDDLFGATTMRTQGTIEQLRAKCFR